MNLFWWNALDIARTSFKAIQNFKFQLFKNSLEPSKDRHTPNLHCMGLLDHPIKVRPTIYLYASIGIVLTINPINWCKDIKETVLSRSEQTLYGAWNRCPSLR